MVTWTAGFYEVNCPYFLLIAKEGGFWETVQALALILSGSILVFGAFRFRWPLLFIIAAFFFFAAGEELNWGQRWFSFATPAPLKVWNIDGQCNLHDSTFMIGCTHMVLLLFAFIFELLLPMIAKYCDSVRYIFKRVPLPPVAFVPFAVFGLLAGLLPAGLWGVSEMQETLFYLVALGGVIVSTKRWNREKA